MDKPYIQFDIDKIKALKEVYEEVTRFILRDLPAVNWNSSKETISYFNQELDIPIRDAKIATIASYLDRFESQTLEFEIILGVIYYLRLKYTLSNYIGCILRHETNGIVYLRDEDGQLRMPNKQPIPLAPEITECIIARHY